MAAAEAGAAPIAGRTALRSPMRTLGRGAGVTISVT